MGVGALEQIAGMEISLFLFTPGYLLKQLKAELDDSSPSIED